MNKLVLGALLLLAVISCRHEASTVYKITGDQLPITDSIEGNKEIIDFIAPYKANIDRQMDSILAYSPASHTKSDSPYNTAIGNMMADAVLEMAGPIFEERTKRKIDAVILNHGGIRAPLPKGDITMRTAFEIMPFENSVVIVEITGKKINEMLQYLKRGKAHPIANIQLIINEEHDIVTATINGKPVDIHETYFIATNDYLQQGGDGMTFLANPVSLTDIDYKIRNLLIDYFSERDTISPARDDRFIMQE